MKTIASSLYYLWGILALTTMCRSHVGDQAATFNEIAPTNYDHLSPPSKNGEIVIVNVSLLHMNVRSVDESDMTFTAAVELWQAWKDERLHFPTGSKKMYQILDGEWVKKLWVPNLYFVNAVEGKLNNIITPSHFFWLTRNSEIFYSCRAMLKLDCKMNVERFPHDEQKCGVQVASAIFSDKSVKLKWFMDSKVYDKLTSMQQFHIITYEDETCISNIATLSSSCLERTFIMRRRSGYFVINTYVPTILIVFMSMLTFWIPPDAVPARTTLGVTSLLTIITKQYQASTPNVSYIVALNVWLAGCITFVFLSLLEFSAVVYLSTKIKESKCETMNSIELEELVIDKKTMKIGSFRKFLQNQKSILSNPRKLDDISRYIFPLAFLVFCFVYWLRYCY